MLHDSWIYDLFVSPSAIQAILVISIISFVGIALGRIKFFGVALGGVFIFFSGIIVGHLGVQLDHQMLFFAQSFGLVIYVYALGLQVGPGLFSSLRRDGVRLLLPAVGVVLLTTVIAAFMVPVLGISPADMAGILCGATTNTPALGAAQQTLAHAGIPITSTATGCAVTYPLGVVGVIFAIIAIRKLIVRSADMPQPNAEYQKNIFIAEFTLTNHALEGRSVQEIASHDHHKFVISRIWHDSKVLIPTSDSLFHVGDRLLVVTAPQNVEHLTHLFGAQCERDWNSESIDWDSVDSQLRSQRIVITRSEINGKKLSSLRLRNTYGINISRIYRSGIQLLASPDLTLQLGDRLTVVGEQTAINKVERILGNAVKNLEEPNLVSVFVGVALGLICGSIPLSIPGIELPVKLGLAAGPILVGILIGTFGPRLHMVTYTTVSANLMLRALGLSIYLACIGLDAGGNFFETVMQPEGLMWIGAGFFITFVPLIIVAYIAMRFSKLDFASTAGLLCGSMSNPMALNFVNDTLHSDKTSVSYATTYPVCMFLRVVIIQIFLMILM